MSHLKLVSEQPTPLERLLLDAAKAEQPSAEHRERLRAALGIAVPAPGAIDSGVPKAARPNWARSIGFGKVLVGLAALALGGALLLERQRSAAVAPVQAVASARRSTVQDVSPPLPEPLPPVLEERSAAAATSASSSVRASRRSSGGAETSDLSEQMHLIEAARTAVAAHDSPAALAALGSYSEKFPRGSFGQEAMVLRIRALDQGGEAARASALARSFIAKFPHSPHVARLKPIAERGSSR